MILLALVVVVLIAMEVAALGVILICCPDARRAAWARITDRVDWDE